VAGAVRRQESLMPGRAVVGLALVALATLAGGLVVAGQTDATPLLGSITMGPDPSAVAVDEQTNRVFVTDHVDGYLRVLDAGSGALLHTVAVDRDGPMAVDEQGGHVFLAGALNGPDKYGVYSDHAVVRMLDARTGGILRTITTNVTGDAAALVVDTPARRVFVVFPGAALVLDARSGAVLRTVAASRSPQLVALDARSGHVFVTNGGDDSVSMFDARQGTAPRTVALGGTPTCVAVDERSGHVFLPTGHGIAVLDARSGALWRTVSAGHPFDAVTVDEQTGRAFVSSAVDNSVSVLDTRGGAVVRIVRAGRQPHVAAVDARSGRVFIGSQGPFSSSNPTGAGSMSVLDARDGTILRTISLGDVTGVAVDARTGRAFVVNRDDRTAPASDHWSWVPPWLRGRLPLIPRPAPRTVSLRETVSVLDATQ